MSEAFILASNLEDILALDEEVALAGKLDDVALGHHGGEEGLAGSAGIGCGAQCMHEVGVAHEYLVRLSQSFQSFSFGMKLADEACTLKEGEEVNELVAGGGDYGTHVSDVGREGSGLGEYHQQAFSLLEGFVLDALNGGDVVFYDGGNDLLKSLEVTFRRTCFQKEWVVASFEILLEVRERLKVAGEGGGELHVAGENVAEGENRQMGGSDDVKILTEGESVEHVDAQAAREVSFGIVNLKQGGTCEDDVELGIVVVDVLDSLDPALVFVHFVKEEVSYAMSEEVFHELSKGVGTEPDIVEGCVEGF